MTMNWFSPIISSSSLPRSSDQSSGHFFTVSKLMWSECFLFHGHLPNRHWRSFNMEQIRERLLNIWELFALVSMMLLVWWALLARTVNLWILRYVGAEANPPRLPPHLPICHFILQEMMMMITTHSLTSTHLLICHFIFLEMIIITTCTLISWNRVSEWACCAFFFGWGGLQLTIKNLSAECYTLLCDVLKSASKLHWAGAALSLVVYVLEQVDQGSKNTSECLSLLLAMRDLAKHIRALLPQLPEADEKLKTATSLIAQGTVLCCTHVKSGTFSK